MKRVALICALCISAGFSCTRSGTGREMQSVSESADSKFLAKDYRAAIIEYDKLILKNTNSSEYYNGRAMSEYYVGNYECAVIDFGKAIQFSPNSIDYYNNRSAAKNALKDFSGAIADCDRALTINPKSAAAYSNRGDNKLHIKDYNGALADFHLAIEIDPKMVEPNVGIGEAYYALNNYGDSIIFFEKAIKLSPENSAAAYRGLGLAQADVLQTKQATTNLLKSLILEPNQIDIENRFYALRIQMGNRDSVISELRGKLNLSKYNKSKNVIRALGAIEPTSLQVQPFLADIVSESDFIKSATNSLWNLILQKQQLCIAYYYAGIKHLIDGDNKSASVLFQKCLKLTPPDYGETGYFEYKWAGSELDALKNQRIMK